MGFFSDILNKITGKTKVGANLAEKQDLNNDSFISEDMVAELEADLIRSDLGVKLACDFCEMNTRQLKTCPIKKSELPKLLQEFLLKAFVKIKNQEELFRLQMTDSGLNIILVVGVNGVGKTTSIGKLAYKLKQDGRRVLIAAGDTFRAAAEEQIDLWAKKAGAGLLRLEEGAKSSTVVFKALEKAKNEGFDVLIIDTAGRVQTKQNLMGELTKLKQVITKNTSTEDQLETMLVLDASTGSNAVLQAEKFNEATSLNSIILTKFDGSAKGGMVFALAYEFGLPVKFIGVGEKLEDLKEFNLDEFTKKYFEN
jgi:fused signal recognition particle receptor